VLQLPAIQRKLQMNSLTIRAWHSYVGIFIAPSVLFFSLTGAMQLFSLHEAHGTYEPPAILENLAKVHKDQVFETDEAKPDLPPKESPQDGTPAAPKHHHDDEEMTLSTMLLKWFFLGVALSLATSTCFGLWLGLTQSRRKRTGIVLLIAGAVIPLALLVF